tara:strand:- start:6160 stop:6369 length:210 start_codon:yes stop_codon:yes gene_type:complete
MTEPLWVFEKEPHVCVKCGGERWHTNKFWANWQGCWFDGDEEGGVDKWCHDCDGETSIMPKDEWEDAND